MKYLTENLEKVNGGSNITEEQISNASNLAGLLGAIPGATLGAALGAYLVYPYAARMKGLDGMLPTFQGLMVGGVMGAVGSALLFKALSEHFLTDNGNS